MIWFLEQTVGKLIFLSQTLNSKYTPKSVWQGWWILRSYELAVLQMMTNLLDQDQ